jgi:hypothetical protein
MAVTVLLFPPNLIHEIRVQFEFEELRRIADLRPAQRPVGHPLGEAGAQFMTGLPDGLFSHQISQVGYLLEGLVMESVGIL